MKVLKSNQKKLSVGTHMRYDQMYVKLNKLSEI